MKDKRVICIQKQKQRSQRLRAQGQDSSCQLRNTQTAVCNMAIDGWAKSLPHFCPLSLQNSTGIHLPWGSQIAKSERATSKLTEPSPWPHHPERPWHSDSPVGLAPFLRVVRHAIWKHGVQTKGSSISSEVNWMKIQILNYNSALSSPGLTVDGTDNPPKRWLFTGEVEVEKWYVNFSVPCKYRTQVVSKQPRLTRDVSDSQRVHKTGQHGSEAQIPTPLLLLTSKLNSDSCHNLTPQFLHS